MSEATTYDIIMAIEAEGVKLSALRVGISSRKVIKVKGRLGDDHRMLIGAYRSDIVHLLGVRNLAANRAATAIREKLYTAAVKRSFAWRLSGDKLRAFEEGWANPSMAH